MAGAQAGTAVLGGAAVTRGSCQGSSPSTPVPLAISIRMAGVAGGRAPLRGAVAVAELEESTASHRDTR